MKYGIKDILNCNQAFGDPELKDRYRKLTPIRIPEKFVDGPLMNGDSPNRETLNFAEFMVDPNDGEFILFINADSLTNDRIKELKAVNQALTEKYQKLTVWYDKHFGTPCEQIKHQQEVEKLKADLAKQNEPCLHVEMLVEALWYAWDDATPYSYGTEDYKEGFLNQWTEYVNGYKDNAIFYPMLKKFDIETYAKDFGED